MDINAAFLRPPSLKSFGIALRKARLHHSLTLETLAHATGISKSYLAHIETARTPGPPSDAKLRLLAKTLLLDPKRLIDAADWLRTPPSVQRAIRHPQPPRTKDGTINLDTLMAKTSPANKKNPNPLPLANLVNVKPVPLINRVAAGAAGEFGDLSYPAGVADAYVAAPDLPEAPAAGLFAVKVSGDSMLPEYREGEIIIVGPGEPKDGEDCVIRLGETENYATTFKRIFFEKQDAQPVTIRLVPLNPAFAERRVAAEEVTGIYPMVYRLVPRRTEARTAAKPSEKLRE